MSALLVLSLNNVTYAADPVKTENTVKNCPTQTATSAYLTYRKSVAEATDLGKLYEVYMNEVEALLKADHFNNVKVVGQDFRVNPVTGAVGSKEITINLTIDFDLNYKAISELAAIKGTDVVISTYERKRCL